MKIFSRISIDPLVCHGKPCVTGHRIPVVMVLELLAQEAEFPLPPRPAEDTDGEAQVRADIQARIFLYSLDTHAIVVSTRCCKDGASQPAGRVRLSNRAGR